MIVESDEFDGMGGLGGIDGISKMLAKLSQSRLANYDAINAVMNPMKSMDWLMNSRRYNDQVIDFSKPLAGMSWIKKTDEFNAASTLASQSNSAWRFMSGFGRNKSLETEIALAINSSLTFPWKNSLPDKYFNSDKDLFMNFLDSISLMKENVRKINNSMNFNTSNELTIDDGLLATLNIDLEYSKKADLTEIEEVIEETNEFLIEISVDFSKVYELLDKLLIKIFSVKEFKVSTELILNYIFKIIFTISFSISFPIENNVENLNIGSNNITTEVSDSNNTYNTDNSTTNNNDNSVTNNTDNSVTNVYNQTFIFNAGDKADTIVFSGLKPVKDKRYKNIIDLPINTPVTVIKKDRVWAVVRSIDEHGIPFWGYIKLEDLRHSLK